MIELGTTIILKTSSVTLWTVAALIVSGTQLLLAVIVFLRAQWIQRSTVLMTLETKMSPYEATASVEDALVRVRLTNLGQRSLLYGFSTDELSEVAGGTTVLPEQRIASAGPPLEFLVSDPLFAISHAYRVKLEDLTDTARSLRGPRRKLRS